MRALLSAALLLAGCGRYGDFRLPPAGVPERGRYLWNALPDPVLREAAVDTLNPSVLVDNGGLLNLYSVFDGRAWHTHEARSAGGLVWTAHRRILSPEARSWEGAYIAANGAAVEFAGGILYYYQAGAPPRIGLARRRAGGTWLKEKQPVLTTGPRGAWDERAVADPYLLQAGGKLFMYYLGEDRARRQRLGLAASNDGVTWTKLRSNPVLELGASGELDENGTGEPAVWHAHGRYWMLSTGRARDETRRMALLESPDGVRWRRAGLVIAGNRDWNSKVVCDATVLPQTGRVRVWFGGGDAAHPAENIHGQIGYGELVWQPERE
ncbi:MAG: hypothetical protein HY858_08560 [Candidatus Solibacter usitatus]|nr:hypothetical protein [Candidatus Solibacter usitatus]